MADFEQAVALVLRHEGGYTPGIPGDLGGETNFGISKRAYPNEDIKNMTEERAKSIYYGDYWRFGDVNDQQAANCLLDCAVNQGLHFALELKEFSLKQIQTNRLLRYSSLAKPQFNHAWFSRVLDV